MQTEILSLCKLLSALLLLFTVLGADAAPREIHIELKTKTRSTSKPLLIQIRRQTTTPRGVYVRLDVPHVTRINHARPTSGKGLSGKREARTLSAGEWIFVAIIAALAICGGCAKVCSGDKDKKKQDDQVIIITAEITNEDPRPDGTLVLLV